MVPNNLPLFSNLTPSKVKAPNTHGRCSTPFLVISQVATVFWNAPSFGLLDFNGFTRSLLPPSSMCPKLQKASISVTCANFRLATRCHVPESAFLRSRQCSCSNTTIMSGPVTFVSFIQYITIPLCVSHLYRLQGPVTHHCEHYVLIIFITTYFGRRIRSSAGSHWNS